MGALPGVRQSANSGTNFSSSSSSRYTPPCTRAWGKTCRGCLTPWTGNCPMHPDRSPLDRSCGTDPPTGWCRTSRRMSAYRLPPSLSRWFSAGSWSIWCRRAIPCRTYSRNGWCLSWSSLPCVWLYVPIPLGLWCAFVI